MQKPRILITGGFGFIGNHLVLQALKRGWQVTALSYRKRAFVLPPPEPEKVEIVHGDLLDKNSLIQALEGREFEYVINCAGYIDHTLFGKGGVTLIEQHFWAVVNLVAVLPRKALQGFVEIGSSDEYGALPSPLCEDLREKPISPYSLGKQAAAQFLQMCHRTEGFPASIARLFLTYGPGQDFKRFLPQIIDGCLNKREFPVSEGRQIRDFCYVEEVAQALFTMLENPQAQGELFNVASGQGVTIREMIEKVKHLVGGGTPEFGKIPYRVGENMNLVADVSKIKRILNWQSQMSLTEGLQHTIDYYQKRLS